jgi:hypothetical protein
MHSYVILYDDLVPFSYVFSILKPTIVCIINFLQYFSLDDRSILVFVTSEVGTTPDTLECVSENKPMFKYFMLLTPNFCFL